MKAASACLGVQDSSQIHHRAWLCTHVFFTREVKGSLGLEFGQALSFQQNMH